MSFFQELLCSFNLVKMVVSCYAVWVFSSTTWNLFIWLALVICMRILACVVLNWFNPYTSMISLVILLTVCHTLLIILVWRIWYWVNDNLSTDIFLYSHHLSEIVLILLGEILSCSLLGVKGLKTVWKEIA